MADAAGGGSKAQAVREVCAASAAFSACTHRRGQRSPRRPPFVDWYLVLAVAEAAPEDAVRRRYRQLALQLHPDKNTHAKAEIAFKIVSEAHACLTDRARRRAFDDERAASYCAACHDRFRHRADRRTPAAAAAVTSTGGAQHGKHRGGVGRRTPVAAQALREVQNRLRDECRVIDSCLKANDAGGGGARRRQSFPLFDPSDRLRFPGYPHTRPPPPTPFAGYGAAAAEFCRFEENLTADQNHRWCGSGAGESPVYQIRTAPERAARTNRHW
uniref:J domain-containing protein n=1 Tax=Oryza punctata TaxID=4537 RepID=A0A0E0KL21_ORYPU